jgi:hypothetical protein
MGGGALWTTFSSSAYGAVSNTRRCIFGDNLLLGLNYGLYSVPLGFDESTFNAGEPTVLGHGSVKDIARVDDLIYVLRTDGIEMWGGMGGTEPVREGMYTHIGSRCMAVSGSHAFIGSTNDIDVLDISNPSQPSLLSSLPLPSALIPSKIEMSGNLLYIHSSVPGIGVIDVSDPSHLQVVGGYLVADRPTYMDLKSSMLVTIVPEQGLLLFNLSTQGFPSFMGSCSLSGNSYGVAVSGNLAFVSDSKGIHAMDITNKRSPVWLGYYPEPPQRPILAKGNAVLSLQGNGNLTGLCYTGPSPISEQIPIDELTEDGTLNPDDLFTLQSFWMK